MKLLKFVVVLFTLIYSVNCLRASYGEACAPGIIRCNSRERLSCVNETCQCAKPDEMRYEKAKNKCVVISGERCSFSAVEILTDERHYTEKFDCVDNAVCSSDGYCDCTANHFEDDEGSCLPKLNQGQNCTNDKECKAEFVCDLETKKCLCNKEKEIYSNSRSKCVGLAEAPCTPYNNNYHYDNSYHCVANAVCDSSRVCKCTSQYFENNRTCTAKRSYGGLCLEDKQCRNDLLLTCQAGACRCKKDEAVFSQSYNQCVGLPGSKCGQNNRCSENAECSRYDKYGSYTDRALCKCRSGFRSSATKTCVGDHGSSCGGERKCSSDFICLNGQCRCPFPSVQTYEGRTCTIYIRGPCQEAVNETVWNLTCPDNASCRDSTGISRCECNNGYVEQAKRCKQKITPGTKCTYGSSYACGESYERMTCRDGQCACNDFHEYNDELGMCQGLVGANCDTTDDSSCVDGAFCKKFLRTTGAEGVCECRLPTKPSKERKCIIGITAETKESRNEINSSSEDLDLPPTF